MCARISARTGRPDKHLAADASQNKEEQPTSEEEEEEAQLRRLTGEEGRHRKYTGTHTLTHTVVVPAAPQVYEALWGDLSPLSWPRLPLASTHPGSASEATPAPHIEDKKLKKYNNFVLFFRHRTQRQHHFTL